MENNKLVIYGIGRYSDYVKYVFDHDSQYEVVAFCVEKSLHYAEMHNGLPLIPFEKLEDQFPPESYFLFIAVGANKIRTRLLETVQKLNYKCISYISSKANVWDDLKIGINCFIGEGSTIQPFVEISDNCILFAVNIGHHSRIGRNVLLSAMTMGGNVEIGDNCFIGMNSTIAQNLKIGMNSVIGMGCTINENTATNSVYSNKGTFKRKISSVDVAHRFLR